MSQRCSDHEFHGLVSAAPAMLEVFKRVERVARSDASVLVRGATGTGKELVARALHALSPRRKGPFRAVNCATFTPELLASELFGHVRGAFTGALRDRPGLFSLAHKGTIFLDEIAELPLDLQARLLRVVQERSFVPVGGTEAQTVDVRIISATHRSLRAEVDAGRFRADLMYRVRVVPLYLPPLADRRGDIELLFWRFVQRHNELGGRVVEKATPEAVEALTAYDWPGNVRELMNAVEHAFAVGEGPLLVLGDLPPDLRGVGPIDTEASAEASARATIRNALREAGGNRHDAAELLGISRSTLWRKMRELGMR